MLKNLPGEYLDDFLVRIAHHSSAIEGNTITLSQTVSIILHNTIPGTLNKREFYEIENHKQAIEYMISCLDNDDPLSITVIKEINNQLMDHLDHNRGNFKTLSNAIVGADFDTAPPEQTPILMYQWISNLNYQLENNISEDEKIRIVLEKHIEFERIHPFNDGNGRTGRLVMNYSLLKNDIPPIIITKDLKSEYMIGLSEQSAEKLFTFAKPLIEKEKERIQNFRNKVGGR
ncbi:MAG: Fic family protein [Fusobacteriaceae bacterium]